MIDTETKGHLEEIIRTHEKYRKSYFWAPRPNASGRRAAEFDNAYEIDVDDKKYEVRQRYEESCKNCYYSLSIYVDGKKKDIRALKKLIGA